MDNTLCKTCRKLIPKKNFARHQLSHSEEKKSLHKGYNSIRMVTRTLTECFEDNPEIRNKLNRLWENVTTVDTFFAKRDPTDAECESAAQVCEEWCELYPVFFPNKNLTRSSTDKYDLTIIN